MKRHYLTAVALLTSCGHASLPSPPSTLRPAHVQVAQESAPLPPLRITVLDVGQGDAVHVAMPSGETVLIDGGRPGQGHAVIRPWLSSQGYSLPDMIIVTHYDLDHIGGISDLLAGPDATAHTEDDHIPPLGCVDRGRQPQRHNTSSARYLAIRPACHTIATRGDSWIFGDATLSIIAVNGSSAPPDIVIDPHDENAHSLVILIQYGQLQYLHMADLPGGGGRPPYHTIDLERELSPTLTPVDILFVGHHGSHTSTSAALLEAAAPQHAIVSAGRYNDFGHPHRTVTDRLDEYGITTWHTVNGHIVIESDGVTATVIQ